MYLLIAGPFSPLRSNSRIKCGHVGYSDRWLSLNKPTIKARTYDRYEELWRLHLQPVFRNIRVRELHRGRIKSFLAAKLTELKPVRIKKSPENATAPKPLARNSVRNIHAILRARLKAAMDDGVLLSNPAEKLGRQLRLMTPKATRKENIKAMTREQRQLFLQTVATETSRYYPFFFTLAGTGMRLGEAIALQPEDLLLSTRGIRVERAFSRGAVETPKSGHGRTVDISRSLAETLARWTLDRKTETLRRGWREVPACLFFGEAGTPLDDSKIRKVMHRVLKKAKLPLHFTPHCLRHTYAGLMLQQGESPAYVQRQLGDASIQLTVDTYGKWLPMGNKGAVDRLDEAASTPSGSKMVASWESEPVNFQQEPSTFKNLIWSRRSGLNGRPAVYETAALPTELRRPSRNGPSTYTACS